MAGPPPLVRIISFGNAHRGRGILPGDFIKPDPALTQSETRDYLLAELNSWLTGRICAHAREVAAAYADLSVYLEDGTWPAARLYTVLSLLEGDPSVCLPVDYEERFLTAAEWSVNVCTEYLRNGGAGGGAAAAAAIGFVTTDTLPCGRVIESFWNHTPFAVLRSAAPLSEESDEESEVSDLSSDDHADDEGRPSIDERIDDMVTVPVTKLLTTTYYVSVPGWVIATGAGIALVYVWTVAAALSVAKSC